MGLSSSKSKTKTQSTTTSSPLAQFAPYINQGLSSAQGIMDSNQGNMQNLSGKALDVANSFSAPTTALGSLYNGTNPAQAAYGSLRDAAANDPSLGIIKGYTTPATNPAASSLTDLIASAQANPASGILSGIATGSANPFVDQMVQQGQNEAIRAANARFANAGMGEGISTPYMDVLSRNVTDAGNKVRYQAYNDNANRQLQAAQGLGSLYDQGQQNATAAAGTLGSQFLAGQQQGLAAAQALGQQQTADNNTALNATNGDVQSQLAALGLIPGMTNAQLGALGTAATIPYAGLNSYANLVNGLTGKYGTTDSNSTQTTKQSQSVGSVLGGLAGTALAAYAGGGFGGGGLGSLFGGTAGGGLGGLGLPSMMMPSMSTGVLPIGSY